MDRAEPDVILVDAQDRELGLMPRGLAHRGQGHRHRAFTVLVLDPEGRLLLARRAAHKLLWPVCFDGTVASHPLPGEPLEAAAQRRLSEELGLAAEPVAIGRFDYQIADGQRGSECELCWTLLALADSIAPLAPDPAEIDRLEWAPLDRLLADTERWPELCPWLWPALVCLAATNSPAPGAQEARAALGRAPQGALEQALRAAFEHGSWELVPEVS